MNLIFRHPWPYYSGRPLRMPPYDDDGHTAVSTPDRDRASFSVAVLYMHAAFYTVIPKDVNLSIQRTLCALHLIPPLSFRIPFLRLICTDKAQETTPIGRFREVILDADLLSPHEQEASMHCNNTRWSGVV